MTEIRPVHLLPLQQTGIAYVWIRPSICFTSECMFCQVTGTNDSFLLFLSKTVFINKVIGMQDVSPSHHISSIFGI